MDEDGRWIAHDERFVYESDWMSMALIDVETPSGQRFGIDEGETVAEAARIESVPLADVSNLVRTSQLGDGLSVTALLAELAGI